MSVTEGSSYCEIDSNGCATDGELNYGNHEHCTIRVNTAGALTATHFSLSTTSVDRITIFPYGGARAYDGFGRGPDSVAMTAGEYFSWRSDSWGTSSGWTICLTPTVHVSDYAACLEHGIDYESNDLGRGGVDGVTASATDCYGACAAVPHVDCPYWVWHEPDGHCKFKSSTSGRRTMSSYTAGARDCDPRPGINRHDSSPIKLSTPMPPWHRKRVNRPRRWYTIHKLCRQVYERSEVVLAVASCIVQCL